MEMTGIPKDYKGFDVLNGSVLEEVDGNCLRIRKDGSPIELYIHGYFGVIYLSGSSTEPNEEVWEGKDVKPFEGFVGKKIRCAEKNFWDIETRLRDLPAYVKIWAEGSPYCYKLMHDDGVIVVEKVPSMTFMVGHINEMRERGFKNLTQEEIKWLKTFERAFPGLIFDEDRLREGYPDLYSKLRG